MAAFEVLITIGFGLFFYWLRSRCRLAYGAIELVAALAVIILTFSPQSHATLLLVQEPPLWGWFLSQSAGTLAGIYVMVRGLDNIHQGLGPRSRAKWERALRLS
jgi:hypothetical protein